MILTRQDWPCGRAEWRLAARRGRRAAVIALLAVAAAGPWGKTRAPRAASSGSAAREVVSGGLGIGVRARTIAPGEVIRIVVRGSKSAGGGAPAGAAVRATPGRLTRVSGTFHDEPLEFAQEGETGTWSAWTVIGFDEKPGTRTLAVEAQDADGRSLRASREVRIASKTFPTEKLTVKEQYVEPPPEVAERIAAETKRLGAVYAARGPSAWHGGPFERPVPGEALGIFGARRILNGKPRAPHPGLDLRAPAGTPVASAGPGRVALAGDLYFSGNTVIVDHGEGLFTIYAHLSRIDVREGDAIAEGAPIGLSGATGRVTGPHLHWGAKIGDKPFDPTALLDRALFE